MYPEHNPTNFKGRISASQNDIQTDNLMMNMDQMDMKIFKEGCSNIYESTGLMMRTLLMTNMDQMEMKIFEEACSNIYKFAATMTEALQKHKSSQKHSKQAKQISKTAKPVTVVPKPKPQPRLPIQVSTATGNHQRVAKGKSPIQKRTTNNVDCQNYINNFICELNNYTEIIKDEEGIALGCSMNGFNEVYIYEGANPDIVSKMFNSGLIHTMYPSPDMKELIYLPRSVSEAAKIFQESKSRNYPGSRIFISIYSLIPDINTLQKTNVKSKFHFIKLGTAREIRRPAHQPTTIFQRLGDDDSDSFYNHLSAKCAFGVFSFLCNTLMQEKQLYEVLYLENCLILTPKSSSSSLSTTASASTNSGSTGIFGSSCKAPDSVPSFSSINSKGTEFAFGASPSISIPAVTAQTGFTFGLSSSSASASNLSSGFSFGASSSSSTSAQTSNTLSGLSFGASSSSSTSAQTINTSSGFSFENPANNGTPPVFNFGTSSTSAPPSTISSSSPFQFGASSGSALTSSSTSMFNSVTPPAPGFSFGAAPTSSITPQPSQPVFGNGGSVLPFGSTPSPSGNGNQMSMEDTMAEDSTPPPAALVFGQPPTAQQQPSSAFVFGTPTAQPMATNPFQFGGQQNQVAAPQNSSPFQVPGGGGGSSFELGAGGSFSLGAGGNDKSNRKIVKVKSKFRRK